MVKFKVVYPVILRTNTSYRLVIRSDWMQFNWKDKNYESPMCQRKCIKEKNISESWGRSWTILLPFNFGLNVGQIKYISSQSMLKISTWVFEFLLDSCFIFSTHLQNIKAASVKGWCHPWGFLYTPWSCTELDFHVQRFLLTKLTGNR